MGCGIGRLQTIEAAKMILYLSDTLVGRLLAFDAIEMILSDFKLRRDPAPEITWKNRDSIQIMELRDNCKPA